MKGRTPRRSRPPRGPLHGIEDVVALPLGPIGRAGVMLARSGARGWTADRRAGTSPLPATKSKTSKQRQIPNSNHRTNYIKFVPAEGEAAEFATSSLSGENAPQNAIIPKGSGFVQSVNATSQRVNSSGTVNIEGGGALHVGIESATLEATADLSDERRGLRAPPGAWSTNTFPRRNGPAHGGDDPVADIDRSGPVFQLGRRGLAAPRRAGHTPRHGRSEPT